MSKRLETIQKQRRDFFFFSFSSFHDSLFSFLGSELDAVGASRILRAPFFRARLVFNRQVKPITPNSRLSRRQTRRRFRFSRAMSDARDMAARLAARRSRARRCLTARRPAHRHQRPPTRRQARHALDLAVRLPSLMYVDEASAGSGDARLT